MCLEGDVKERNDDALETKIYLTIDDPESGDTQEKSLSLRQELADLGLAKVEFLSLETLENAKSAGAIDWNTLILTLIASGGALTTILSLLQSWLSRNSSAKISIEIDGDKLEITGKATEEHKELISLFTRKHQGFISK